jgi:DNA-3-methyladenine glycosylase II
VIRSSATVLPVVLDAESVTRAARILAKRDAGLASILRRLGPPPLWARKPGFSTLIKIILEQQVSLASAAAIYARLQAGIIPFQPGRMIALGEPYLRRAGLTRQKTAYCLHLAQSLCDKDLKLRQLARMNDEEAKSKLMEIKGVGSWSADIYLLMALRRPDVWPSSDLALAVAISDLRGLTARPSPNELLEIAKPWRPYRSVAARMLWQYYLAQRGKL